MDLVFDHQKSINQNSALMPKPNLLFPFLALFEVMAKLIHQDALSFRRIETSFVRCTGNWVAHHLAKNTRFVSDLMDTRNWLPILFKC